MAKSRSFLIRSQIRGNRNQPNKDRTQKFSREICLKIQKLELLHESRSPLEVVDVLLMFSAVFTSLQAPVVHSCGAAVADGDAGSQHLPAVLNQLECHLGGHHHLPSGMKVFTLSGWRWTNKRDNLLRFTSQTCGSR